MTVNVSLCGCIPRSQMDFSSTKQLRELDMNSDIRSQNDVRHNGCKTPCSKSMDKSTNLSVCLPRQVSCEQISASSTITPSPPPIIEPPSWAVAAKGDARLEPVCDSSNLQTPIDLTKQAVYRVGRSQNSEVQLLHCNSSRRHAMLFHHPNGSCYVVDCGSAYGTYVNGVRVSTIMSPQHQANGSSGIILPHKVKRGSLIRFGGPGAPCFILKSFAVGLETLVENVKVTKKISICHKSRDIEADPETCKSEIDKSKESSEALVTLNTRLNAIGSSLKSFSPRRSSLSLSSAHIHSRLQPLSQTSTISFLKKRSIVSFDDSDSEAEAPPLKKRKQSFMTPSTFDQFASSDVAIVSPSRQKPILQFNFDSVDLDRRVVSPTPTEVVAPLSLGNCINLSGGHTKSILKTPISLPCAERKNRRVNFSDTTFEVCHPRAVSIDESD